MAAALQDQGCFNDFSGNRDLPTLMSQNDQMTGASCMNWCARDGGGEMFLFAGTQVFKRLYSDVLTIGLLNTMSQ